MQSIPRPGRRSLFALALLALLIAAFATVMSARSAAAATDPSDQPPVPSTTVTPAGPPVSTTPVDSTNPNNLSCWGSIKAGTPVAYDFDQQVAYSFNCSGPITGYAIQPQIGDTGFGDSAVVYYYDHVTPSPADGFTCAGSIPGAGFGCVGQSARGAQWIDGQFSIGTLICAEPRVDPLLTVFSAIKDPKTGVVTQGISGPFDLHRPTGCPKSRFDQKERIKKNGDIGWYPTGTATDLPPLVGHPKKKAAPKTKSTKKTTKK